MTSWNQNVYQHRPWGGGGGGERTTHDTECKKYNIQVRCIKNKKWQIHKT